VLARARGILFVAAAAALAGCGRRESAADAHAGLACVSCHRGRAADLGRAPVTDAGCTARGCHPGGGADTARLAGVSFVHRGHPDGGGGALPCASCHTHTPGSTAIVADTAACALCHVQDLAETQGRRADCRRCHVSPQREAATSQGVPIPHAQLDDSRVPCTRCHYQVLEGRAARVKEGCAGCHADSAATAVRGAEALHASHRAYRCQTCHEPVRHRVTAMSTSVNLACLDCHRRGHRRRNHPADVVPTARCEGCHTDVHAEEQRLILGILPGEPIEPSPMFLGGVTCRSCHVPPGRPGPSAGHPLVSNDAACTGCHGPQWTGYLARWRRGYLRREAWVDAYLAGAERAFADSTRRGAARAQVRQARSLLAFLRAGGPVHNLPATDRTMRRALDLAVRAYAVAGLSAPAPPELGPPVLAGSCMSCHYGIEEAGASRDSTGGRGGSHGGHMFVARLACDACHAVGAAPPGLPDSLWIDTLRLERGGPPSRRRRG